MRLQRAWSARTLVLALGCWGAGAAPAWAGETTDDAAKVDEPVFIWQDEGSPSGLPTTLASKKHPDLKVTFYGFLDGAFHFEESRMGFSVRLPALDRRR